MERVRVVRRRQWQLGRGVVLVVTLPVLRAGRVEVDRTQKQRRGALPALRQTSLPARRVWSSVTDQRLPVDAERQPGTHLAVAVVSEQNGPRPLGAWVVRREVGRMPAGLGGDAQPEVGQGTELGVVELVEQRDDGRLEDGQLQRLVRLVDVGPIGGRVVARLGGLETQPHRSVPRQAHDRRVSTTQRVGVLNRSRLSPTPLLFYAQQTLFLYRLLIFRQVVRQQI